MRTREASLPGTVDHSPGTPSRSTGVSATSSATGQTVPTSSRRWRRSVQPTGLGLAPSRARIALISSSLTVLPPRAARKERRRSQLPDLLFGLVQVLDHAVRLDQEVIADEGEVAAGVEAGMHRHVHVGGDRYGLVGAQQRPLDQIVALAVAVEAQLGRRAMAGHELVVAGIDLRGLGADLEVPHRVLLRLDAHSERVAQLRRGLAEHEGAGELGIVAARPIVLDQECHVVARAHGAALVVAAAQDRGLAKRRRGTAEQALFAA